MPTITKQLPPPVPPPPPLYNIEGLTEDEASFLLALLGRCTAGGPGRAVFDALSQSGVPRTYTVMTADPIKWALR